MIMIRPTRDLELVRRIITLPVQWAAATDAASPARHEWQPSDDERIIYLEASEHNRVTGILTLIPRNAATYEIHIAMDISRFKAATKALGGAIAWAFAATPARRIIGEIPRRNGLAIRLAEAAGMTIYGVNPRSFLKHGELDDQALLGISK